MVVASGAERIKRLQKAWRDFSRKPEPSPPANAVIGFAGTFTVDPLLPYVGGLLLESGIDQPKLLNANFNQVLRVCLDPSSEFGPGRLDAIAILWRVEDLADLASPEQVASATNLLLDSIGSLRENFSGMIILATPPRPRPFEEGIVAFSRPSELHEIWLSSALQVAKLSRTLSNVHVVDLEAAIAECGVSVALDHRKALLYRQPYTEAFYLTLADMIDRIYGARRREAKKCIVVDCDNTLWGGVIGEDGVGGVQLSQDFPGNAFLHFQRQIVALRKAGVFVALNSKNNPDDVWEMFDAHDGMALKRSDISVAKINWKPKSDNLKEIAKELNIGLDSLVFVDDSRFEIEEVRTHAPEVTCVLVPEDIADLPSLFLESMRAFDRLEVTSDDRSRVDMMAQEIGRRDLSQKMSEAEFLGSLGLQVRIYPPSETDLARVTQLINKTNQFNVTTRRYSLDEIVQRLRLGKSDLYCASVKDRFGDYGLVGVGIVDHNGGDSEFDTLLMSCRVLGRGIETAMISHAIELARSKGSEVIRGRYIPTPKNGMVADLFERHGFAREEAAGSDAQSEGDTSFWHRQVDPLSVPPFLAVNAMREG